MGFARSIRGKLLALVALCTVPMALAVAFLVDRGVGKDIRFAEKEHAGNVYQRPLLELVAALRHVHLLAAGGRQDEARDEPIARVEAALEAAAAADATWGETLRVTADAIEADGRDVAALDALRSQWPAIAAAIGRDDPLDLAALDRLIQAARRLALVAGDTSNLILDPDLDSYYLMDLTNLAVPDAIMRLGRVGALRADIAAGDVSGADAQLAWNALAALIDEVDLPRIAGSARSALAEDERFYGASESLPARMVPALAAYESAARTLVDAIRGVALDPILGAPLDAPALDALRASEALWLVASEELDVLLAKRIATYRRARVLALSLALAGFIAAALAGRQISHAIVRSLERSRAMAERVAAGDLSASAVESGSIARDETGAVLASLTGMAGGLARIVAEVVASASAISDASAKLEAKTVALQDRARAQKQAVVDATDVTCEASLASEGAAEHGTQLMEAAEATRSSMSEIETQAGAIEREMEQLSAVVSQLLTAMQQMTANARSIASSADSLRGAGDQTVHSVDDLRRSISSIEQAASISLDDARAMLASAEQGELATRDSMAANQAILDAFQALRSAIEQLQSRSSRIEQVLAVIDGVADEVGLLSLNASIIAAQSGEHGRSFAVVANEIRELARETDTSSKEISKSVTELQRDILGVSRAVASGMGHVQRGFERAQEAASTLHGLADHARASAERARQISEAAGAQSVSVGAVEHAASAVHGGVIEIGSSVVEYSAAVDSVRDMVTGVDGLAKSVLSAAALQTGESASVSKAMRDLIERARALEAAAARQRDGTGRMGASIGVFRASSEDTDDLVTELGRIVELLRERSQALSHEVALFRL